MSLPAYWCSSVSLFLVVSFSVGGIKHKHNNNERPIGQIDQTGRYDYESTTASSRIDQHIPSPMSNVDLQPQRAGNVILTQSGSDPSTSNVILRSNRLFPSIPLSRTSDQSLNVVSPFTLSPTTNLTVAPEARSGRLASHAETAQTHIPNPSRSRKISEARQQEIQADPSRSDYAPAMIMRDADSGIRLYENGNMVETLPPAYTAAWFCLRWAHREESTLSCKYNLIQWYTYSNMEHRLILCQLGTSKEYCYY